MGFLRRILGLDRPRVAFTVTMQLQGSDDRLGVVVVGGVRLDAAVWEHYQRDTQDWSNGIRVMDPRTGRWLRDDADYPPDLLAAGARSIAVVGLGHHEGSQAPAFGYGNVVRLVPDPRNPVDPNAITVRSPDGRLFAGYVPADELERIRAVVPPPVLGLVVWENYSWRPRRRIGMRILIGPTIQWGLVPPAQEPKERARREVTYAAGREQERLEDEAARAAAEAGKLATKVAKRLDREARAMHRAERDRLDGERRAAGVCLSCGGPIEPHDGRGRRPIRCASCRTALPVVGEPPAPASAVPEGQVGAIAALMDMRDRGLVTEADYEATKAELIGRI